MMMQAVAEVREAIMPIDVTAESVQPVRGADEGIKPGVSEANPRLSSQTTNESAERPAALKHIARQIQSC